MASTTAAVQLTVQHSALTAGLRAAGAQIKSWAASTGAMLSGGVSGAASLPGKMFAGFGRSAVALAGFGLAKRGIDMLVEGASDVFDFERKLTRLGIASRLTDTQLGQYRSAARETSVATGQDAKVVLDSVRAYTDLAGAQAASISKMNILARAGQASEASGRDLAGMMYQLTRSFKVGDDQMEDTIGGLINQAKDGAIEAKQMAAEFAGMAPIFARFGVVGREGAVQLGAMYQITRDGFDSAAQAATGMIRLMAGFQRHASRFAQHGVQVFKPGSKSELREISDIMKQIKGSDLAHDTEALIKAFGRSEAWRTFQLLSEAPDRMRELEEAGRANGIVQQDLARYTESMAGRLDIAMAKVKMAFAEALTPERVSQIVGGIEAMVSAVGPLMNAVSTVAEGFSNFMKLAAAARAKLGGGNHKELSDKDQALVDAAQTGVMRDNRGREHFLTPEEKERAKQLKKGQDEYNHAIDRIMEAEDAYGPTDASIKRAVEYGHSWYGSGTKMPGDQAGIAYLKARDGEISSERYKRIDAQVSAEDAADAKRRKKEADSMWAPQGMDVAAIQNKVAAQAMIDSAVDRLARTLGEMLGRGPVVEIDGNPVAKASKNATDQRRR